MRDLVLGSHFSIASPHYRSTFMGATDFLDGGNAASAVMSAALSASFHLPDLCGLGGDAIILSRCQGRVDVFNGTGRTGRHQHRDAYLSKGLLRIPRRGVHSTMVYGCPAAYGAFVKRFALDLDRIIAGLLKHDLSAGFIPLPRLQNAYRRARTELGAGTAFDLWQRYMARYPSEYSRDAYWAEETLKEHTTSRNIPPMCTNVDPTSRVEKLFRRLRDEGFHGFYTGSLGEQTHRCLQEADRSLFDESDFTGFVAPPAVLKRSDFLDARLSAHGSNSPWRELFLLLDVYACYRRAGKTLDLKAICDAAGHLGDYAQRVDPDGPNWRTTLRTLAEKLYQRVSERKSACDAKTADFAAMPHQAHTIFLACAQSDGTLHALTNSIFTPFGALLEISDSAVLLSNRAFSFNAPDGPDDYSSSAQTARRTDAALEDTILPSFQPGVPAAHTNNCVLVETDSLSFVIGTSGGSVQAQTLAAVIDRVVACGDLVSHAVSRPRVANLGWHPAQRRQTYLSEDPLHVDAPFTATGLTDKLGVVQVAGIDHRSGKTFAFADPRGDGSAMAW